MRAQYGQYTNGYLLTAEQEKILQLLEKEYDKRQEIKEQQEEAKEAQDEPQVTKTAGKTADDYAIESNKQLDKALAKLELEAKLKGETVDQQEKYNLILQNYINLLTETEGLIKEGYPVEVARKEQLEAAAAAAEREAKAKEDAAKAEKDAADAAAQAKKDKEEAERNSEALAKAIGSLNGPNTRLGQIKAEADEIRELEKKLNDDIIMSDEERAQRQAEIDKATAQNKREQWEEILSNIKDFTNESVNIANEAAALVQRSNEAQTKKELADNELKYRKGEINQKQYEEKKKAIKKKAADDQYKIDMFNWTTSLLTATANIAQGVSKAIAQGGVMGIATGALVAAAGGVQIASIIASKPQPPQFANGGIVPGQSYTGDRVTAKVNSGEMILTTGQQAALFNMANGKGGTNRAPNITINNSASNLVDATPQVNGDEIGILIDAKVNDSLQQGRYNKSLTIANQGQTGTYYGI